MKQSRFGLSFFSPGGRSSYLLLSLLLLVGAVAQGAAQDVDHCAQTLLTGVPHAYEMAFDGQQGRAAYFLFLRARAYHMDTGDYIQEYLHQAPSLRALVRRWSKELAMRWFLTTAPEGAIMRENLTKKTRQALEEYHHAFYRLYLQELAGRLKRMTNLPWQVQQGVWGEQQGTALVLTLAKNHPWPQEELEKLVARPGPLQILMAAISEVYRQWQAEVVPGDQNITFIYGDFGGVAQEAAHAFGHPLQITTQVALQDAHIFLPWYIFDEGGPALSSLQDAISTYLKHHR